MTEMYVIFKLYGHLYVMRQLAVFSSCLCKFKILLCPVVVAASDPVLQAM